MYQFVILCCNWYMSVETCNESLVLIDCAEKEAKKWLLFWYGMKKILLERPYLCEKTCLRFAGLVSLKSYSLNLFLTHPYQHIPISDDWMSARGQACAKANAVWY